MEISIIFLALIFGFSASLPLDEEANYEIQSPLLQINEIQSVDFEKRQVDLEERDGHNSGILRVLESMVGTMQTILQFADGHATLDDIVQSVQNTFKSAQQLVNIKAIISEVPFIGKPVAWVLDPILNLFASLIDNTPVFGGLLKQLVVGPSYPVEPPPPPPPPPTTVPPPTTKAPGIWGNIWGASSK